MQNLLLNAIQQSRAPHAILISGPEGSGRRELARRCAALYCLGEDAPQRLVNCPNYYEIGEGAVKVDDIRTLLSSAAMQGFNGGQRAFVFVNAQLMSTQIQNTLLKTLEEPHSETMLIQMPSSESESCTSPLFFFLPPFAFGSSSASSSCSVSTPSMVMRSAASENGA